MIPRSTDGKLRVLSLSYGKDSLACLGAIEQLGWPLDGIVHAEVWFDDDTPADLPPMVEFKAKADAVILERYGLTVEHVCATRGGRRRHTEGDSTSGTHWTGARDKGQDIPAEMKRRYVYDIRANCTHKEWQKS